MYKKFIVIFIGILMIFTSVFPIAGMITTNKTERIIPEAGSDDGASARSGNIIYVGGTGPNNYTTIQSGINAAQPGDTVFVYHKTYYEHVTVNKALHLIGEDQNTTSINGTGVGDVIYISSNNVYISGFTITGSGTSTSDAAIDLHSSYNTVTHNRIIGNWSRGPGIYLYLSSYNTISENIVTTCGTWGSIYLYGSSYNLISGNEIADGRVSAISFDYGSYNTVNGNTVIQGEFGAVEIGGSTHSIITGNTFIDHGIWVHECYYDYTPSSNITISENVLCGLSIDHSLYTIIRNNTFGPGYGISLENTRDTLIIPYWTSHIMENNTVNGKPIYYFKNEANIGVPSDAGQVILANCSHCVLRNFAFQVSRAIQLGFSSYITIINNTILTDQFDHGIYTYFSSYNEFIGNTITCTTHPSFNQPAYWVGGIEIERPLTNNTIIGNNITGFNYGIDFWTMVQPDHLTIRGNAITSIYGGIWLKQYAGSDAQTVFILNNTITNCTSFGIAGGISNLHIIGNRLIGCGIICGGTSHIIENNTVNGKPVYYLKNMNNVTIPSFIGQVILANCTHVSIQDLSIDHASVGIHLDFCSNITITRCSITFNNDWSGGISIAYSSFITIHKNIISNNSQEGVYLDRCHHVFITDNFIIGSSEWSGIRFYDSDYNNVIGNTFMKNQKGIDLCASNYNNIYHNSFLNKTGNYAHAYDYNGVNQWDNSYPGGGNYWDDYTGSDTNNDGMGETPYNIADGASQDHYPLSHRFVLGDMNVDTAVDFGDINPFVLALSNPSEYKATYAMLPGLHGDINNDGACNFGDINPFVTLLTTGHYP